MAKKRANGEGNIRKRSDGRWEGRYTAGYDDKGKRIIKNVLGRTQAEVKDKLKRAMEQAAGLNVSRTDGYTVTAWLNTWYDLYAKPNIRLATQNRYELMIKHYAVPHIGDIKLSKLTGHDLQKLYKELQESGRMRPTKKSGDGLSSTTVRSLHLMLHCAFERAVKERLIQRNPTDDCIAPKVRKVEMHVLPFEHVKAYLDAAAKHNALPMFYLELVSGLRKGELVALLWSDVDTAHHTVSVSKQYVRNPNGECTVSRPKTENSVRLVSIPQEAIDLLIEEHNKHPDNPYLFPSSTTGEMYHPDSVVNLHKKLLKNAGLEHIRFHDLRHTFATMALQNGVDVKTVSAMLGHYDAGFTLRTYTHATRQAQDAAALTMGEVMAQAM
jgi:integrase